MVREREQRFFESDELIRFSSVDRHATPRGGSPRPALTTSLRTNNRGFFRSCLGIFVSCSNPQSKASLECILLLQISLPADLAPGHPPSTPHTLRVSRPVLFSDWLPILSARRVRDGRVVEYGLHGEIRNRRSAWLTSDDRVPLAFSLDPT
jgi:hypothetical protein